MTVTTTYKTPFRRRGEGKTDYAKRLAMVKSEKIRIVVRTTNTRITVQAIKYNPKGDETIAFADSRELKNYSFYGTNNTPSAYLTGFLLGKKFLVKENEGILDIGMKTPSHGSIVFAALKGVADAGVKINYNQNAVPSKERISGKVLDDYAKTVENADKVFSGYKKAGINPGEIEKAFEKAKSEIEKVSK
jgi:large subunit ribosomal protein L18